MKDFAAPVVFTEATSERIDTRSRLVMNTFYTQLLAANGFHSFEDFHALKGGTVIKQLKDRAVLRFEIDGVAFYLKKFTREKKQVCGNLQQDLIRWCSEGGKEFSNFCAFRQNGLATAIPVAMGEKVYSDNFVESFLLTEDFSPLVQLEYLIRYQPEKLKGAVNRSKRLNILRSVAAYARKMHQQGFNHRDFNATHVLLAEVANKAPQVVLSDLQRVDMTRLSRFRWPIKTMAEFNYTIREGDVFLPAEQFFLFESYLGKEGKGLHLFEHLKWKWIQAKTDRIARHTAKRRIRKSTQ